MATSGWLAGGATPIGGGAPVQGGCPEIALLFTLRLISRGGRKSPFFYYTLRLALKQCQAIASNTLGRDASNQGAKAAPRLAPRTTYGDIEFGFFPHVAPKTVDHIFKLVRLGCYNTNHFFRVDRGFVAQVADVVGGRTAPMNDEQRLEAEKTVVGEFSNVKHVRGILSMGRYSDPDSASSSFSILLGDAPHLDGEYAIFGRVTKGDDTLRKLEELPTRRDGIFVMPTERITILSAYYYDMKEESCEYENSILKRRLSESAIEIEKQRLKCFS